jgi:hypothetical protein
VEIAGEFKMTSSQQFDGQAGAGRGVVPGAATGVEQQP